jgi:hypothetical protein
VVAVPAQAATPRPSTSANTSTNTGTSQRSTRRSTSRPAASGRPRRSLYQPSFYQRHRTALLSLGVVAILAVIGGFFFFSATAAAYTCTTISQPEPSGTPLPNGSPAPLGQSQPDMGNLHISIGSSQRYSYCPPASGPHYNNPGVDGPIPAKYYGPDAGVRPQNWIHNLEHGAVVVLYNCNMGACTDSSLAALQQIPVNFPDSPVCGIKAGVLAPVVARFDTMPEPYVALVWNRLMYMTTLDRDQIIKFYETEGETTNPEPQCARPSPSAAPSAGPSSAPSGATGSSPSAAPVISPSAEPSSAPTPAASPSPS